MVKTILEGERQLVAWVTANISLGGAQVVSSRFHLFSQSITPVLNFLLLVLQIIVAAGATVHITQKIVAAYRKRHENK